MLGELPQQLMNPGSRFRGKPFWAWNSRLEPGELRRQIRLFKRMGFGGFFMHSRTGLETGYLGKDWFDCVRACVDEAKKLGLEAWAYDEDRWPSGIAGGLVTKNPACRRRLAFLEVIPAGKKLTRGKNTLLVLTGKISGRRLSNPRLVGPRENPRPGQGESVIRIFYRTDAPRDLFNGQTYLDMLNPAAVAEFIKTTHEAYKHALGREFGRTVPGIFTDEANFGRFVSRDAYSGQIPWTPNLPTEFKKRYGYDIIPHLAEVFYDVEGAGLQTRYHFLDCVTSLFVEAFPKQCGEWCGKNRWRYTGHTLDEDKLSNQAQFVGDCMRFYEPMQVPGMDLLSERWRFFPTAKQVASVARQCGRQWRISETYGVTGWDFPFAGHKALGDWQLALGINIRCHHLAWYSMRGEAKRDFPASIFYQSPWWEEYRHVEDYFARAGAVMTRGEEIRDILLISPIESVWLKITVDNWISRPDTREIDNHFIMVSDRLLADNLDHDYGDEELMSRRAKTGRDAQGAWLKIGKAVYRAVVLPKMLTMRAATLKLLRKFRALGGMVVFTAPAPEMVDALPSAVPGEFARECVTAAIPALARALAPWRRVSVADARGREIGPALYLLRSDAEAYYLFICNTGVNYVGATEIFDSPRVCDRKLAFPEVTVRGFGEVARAAGEPLECDLETGELRAAAGKRGKAGWEIRTSLPRLGSRLFIIPREKGDLKAAASARAELFPRKTLAFKWEFAFTLSEANVLPLDWPEYSLDGGETRRAEILTVDREARAALGLEARRGTMVQPWVRGRVKNPRFVTVALDYRFMAECVPSGGVELCLENPGKARVFVNGYEVPAEMECGWWCDPSLRKLAFSGSRLRLGENHVRIVYNYDENDAGLEIVYLRGNFAVKNIDEVPTLCALPKSLRPGDWTAQGLPFYGGAVIYRQNVRMALGKKEKALLDLGDWRGAVARVRVNGADAGLIGWAPNVRDITALVKNGAENTVEIEVFGSRRNSHGPLHMEEKWPLCTGPEKFLQNTARAYNLVPCGLLSSPRIIIAE